MCNLFGSSQDTTTSTSSSPLDPLAQKAFGSALNSAMQINQQSYPGYDPTKRVEPLSAQQQQGLNQITSVSSNPNWTTNANTQISKTSGLANVGPSYINDPSHITANQISRPAQSTAEAIRTAQQLQAQQVSRPAPTTAEAIRTAQQLQAQQVGAPSSVTAQKIANPGNLTAERLSTPQRVNAQQINSQRLVDQGRLGSVNDYMNPFLQQALNPVIRDMQEAGQKQRVGIGANATAAGAFGDARHGIVEAEQMRGEQRNIGDLSSQAYMNAFNTAMAQREADLNRFLGADTTNAANNLQAGQFNVNALMAQQGQNADRALAAGQFNTNAAMQADLANQAANLQAGQFNVDARMKQQLANQAANLQAGQFNITTDQARQGQNVANQMQTQQFNTDALMKQQLANQAANLQAGQFNVTTDQARQGQNIANQMQTQQYNIDALMKQQAQNAANNLTASQFNVTTDMDAEKFNAGAMEQAYARQLAASQQAMDMGVQSNNQLLNNAMATLQAGALPQQVGQAQRDAQYEEYLRSFEYPFRQADVYSGLLHGLPTAQTVTTTKDTGNQDLMALLGSAIGTGLTFL